VGDDGTIGAVSGIAASDIYSKSSVDLALRDVFRKIAITSGGRFGAGPRSLSPHRSTLESCGSVPIVCASPRVSDFLLLTRSVVHVARR